VPRLTSSILAAALVTPLLAAGGGAPAGAQTPARRSTPARQIAYTQWDTPDELAAGTVAGGAQAAAGRVTLASGAATGSWRSPWTRPAFALTELVASWSARTPGDSDLQVQVRGRSAGRTSSWDTLGLWASGDGYVQRRTFSGQADDLGSVSVDTWEVPAGAAAYQLRVVLTRRVPPGGSTLGRSPSLDTVGAVASRLPASTATVPTSRPGVARGVVLDVPRYSQMIHDGQYPQYGGGGEAWCSPTSTSMVLGYYGALPRPRAYAWVNPSYRERWVDHAARMTYDHDYDGTGNWPFNTAYAAGLAGHAFVTRLHSLRDAEVLVRAGIPVVASIAFASGQLAGAPIRASNGHLVVIVGFTSTGDPVVNDPAASSDAGVRRTYDRGQFENAWLRKSGGAAYVITDDAHPLPAGGNGSW
jgi:hypothetical protein